MGADAESSASRAVPVLRGLAAALAMAAAGAVPAAAQQVFVNRLWVHHAADTSGSDQNTCSVTVNKHQINCYNTCVSYNPNTTCSGIPQEPGSQSLGSDGGNISNDPRIEFELPGPMTDCKAADSSFPGGSNQPSPGANENNVCNSEVFLCMQVGHSNTQSGASPLSIDFINFEVFKYKAGTNPLDTGSAPPLRTFYVDNPGVLAAGTHSDPGTAAGFLPFEPVCVLWDGTINIQGELGKSNGIFGFRSTVETNQLTEQGNVKISQTRAYPGGWTKDANGNVVDEKPITVEVTNVHVVRTSPTVVGQITGVAAEPYNITYRLSKDATMYLDIYQANSNGSAVSLNPVRRVVPGQPRVGEGIPDGTLRNGDSWNGRFENGDLGPPGVFLASLQAFSVDQFGADLSAAVTRQIALDTLQITDIRVQALTETSTSLAVLSYLLTEPATVYVDIYPPGTQFRKGIVNLNSITEHPDLNPNSNSGVRKDFDPCLADDGAGACDNPAILVRHFEEFQNFRSAQITFWDGRDKDGSPVPDGDYVFVVYASLPSQNGFSFLGNNNDKRIWSTNARSGYLSVARGHITINQIGPSSTVIGSSPPVAGLDPFSFVYSLSREALVTFKILDASGKKVIKTLVDDEVRPGNFQSKETWQIPTDDDGLWVSSGVYMAQLSAADPFFRHKVTTTTVMFPVNLFRITDVRTTPLLTGATDVVTVAYQLSQPMRAALNIYPPGTVVSGSTGTWPPCGSIEPGACGQVTNNGVPVPPLITIKGQRPGRLRITEFWDGRDLNGIFVADGAYVFTVTAESTTTPKYFATDRITGQLIVARGAIIFNVFSITPTFPSLFNSSQTISLPSYEIDYSLTRQSSVTIQVLTTNASPTIARNLVVGEVRDANSLNREFWDARDDLGNFVDAGFYTVRAIAEDLASVLSSGSTAQQTISVDPLRIYDVAVSPLDAEFREALIAYQVSETMKTSLKIYKPGTTFDVNGNASPPEAQSLVQRFVNVVEARREISQTWDGTDEKGSLVEDGNYLFKILASTDMKAFNDITGDKVPGAVLAQDLVIAEIPVVRGSSFNPFSEFQDNSFVYPNPIEGNSARFQIFVPIEANVSMKVFNIAGDLVLTRDFGRQPKLSYVNFDWDKTNQHGRKVAHGVYFYLLRQESAKGEAVVLQTIKKLLIP